MLQRVGENQLLSVNFDEKLVEVLREVHYLLTLCGEGPCTHDVPTEFEANIPKPVDKFKEKLPEESIQLFEKSEPLREARLKLAQIANAHNTVNQQTYTVEYPLISTNVTNFNNDLAPAFDTMNWENCELFYFSKIIRALSMSYYYSIASQKQMILNSLIGTWQLLAI